ncbi:4-(cytidine 5'-diphospho)-2-C-methyl-D-erythritol kinase [Candidatus Xianfuyuplasma coldseepsis]|uniref:4-diphosphocytidyl-2-C-methyl-D-erythritol kinase n=1 Tax=Candidatus Xianfuyuplasma coldseepsis TaxID=2782163 RepID=A0A7L7KQ87_9MOLU|nr:4-(cytidine 5'-diphospho)-2-C-methyl-D-erythritol kinase [Xianfuyuplasma coldseepsis]QMS84961.1 4-(cytidine 5'-diphospho)-2-C-methyl-D-erythritol kinase [Xianfuyuplasma coldseepsis]
MKEKAYAKVNLFLNVIQKRTDGYHDLEMVMASINLFDVLSFDTINDGIEIVSDKEITPNVEDNIVYKVARFLQEHYHVTKGVRITIQKNIPIAAGLGGGSADAAATLRGLNKLWKLQLSLDKLAEIGLLFGSDVPFCVYNKLCIAKGRGEELAFLDNKLNIPILIVNPNIPISTKDVFQQVQPESMTEHKINHMTMGIYNRNTEIIAKELYNSLEPVVFTMEPKIQALKDDMLSWGASGALMSGSGATVFAIDSHKKVLKQVQETIPDSYFNYLTKLR